MAKPESFLVSCDIGSSKVCVLIGEPNARGGLDILGKGATQHRGTRKGNIINVDSTVEAIKRSAEEAEIMAGAQITRAYAGLSGSAVRSFNSRGVVAVAGKARRGGLDGHGASGGCVLRLLRRDIRAISSLRVRITRHQGAIVPLDASRPSHRGSCRRSVARGRAPWPSTASWKAVRSKALPACAVSSVRRACSSRWPIM